MAETDAPREDWQKERGGEIDHSAYPGSPIEEEERIDESIAESFPASDPPSWTNGIDRTAPGTD